ncbi:MAG TPA: Tim44/TimA family putative adaptor protein [Stellaceae bacterium]|nr:Tim44/TimA family putative adaptor protein [Stellaceae bacterium]
MDGDYQLLDILLFAAIAGFLVFRLRSVLGRRTGLERRRDPFTAPPAASAAPAPVLRAINGGGQQPPATGIGAVKAADPAFSEASFLQGAQGAFEIVVKAFAAGDTKALQPLLSKDVFERFAEAITTRKAARETLETRLSSMKSAEIGEASVEGGTALVTVKFVTDQINVTRRQDGTISDGEPDHPVEHVDFWTFARPVRARDPNWTLVATKSP